MATTFDTPSGDYSRDLEAGKNILFRRGGSEAHRELEDESRTLEFIASTDGIKRDGNRVRNDGWDFSNFQKNPVFLWGHDQGGGDSPPLPPIGSIQEYWIEELGDGKAGGMGGEITSRLMIRVKFAEHELAETVYNLYRQGHLRAVSIGWTPLEYEPILDADGAQVGWDFIRSELLEVSAVPIPSDPDALMTAAASGILPQAQLGEFARALRSSRAGAYWLDSRAMEKAARETSVENVETREIEWQDGERVLKGLEDEIDKLAEAIERQDKAAIEDCVAMTEKLIEEHETFLHAVYDEHLAEEDPTEDPTEDGDEEARFFKEMAERLRDLADLTATEDFLQNITREYGPEMLDALRNLVGDLRGDMTKLKEAAMANDAAAIALEIGHAMERLGDIESILSAIYSEFIFEEQDTEEAPADESEEMQEEVAEDEDQLEAGFDELVASLDELIVGKQSRQIVASEGSETANLARVSDGLVNLAGAWELTTVEENAILGDPDSPDWEAYGSAHLGRETDAPEDTKDHYKYPVAKIQDGDLVVYVAALRAVRSYASREGAEGVFEAAGRLIEAVKATLTDEDQAEETVAGESPTRIGKKVSQVRADQLTEAREMAASVCRILDTILSDSGKYKNKDEDDDSRGLDDDALMGRLGELAAELGVPTEADLIARISDLAETLSANPDTPEEFAEKMLAAK